MIFLTILEPVNEKGDWNFEYPVLFNIPDEKLSTVITTLNFLDKHADVEEAKVNLEDVDVIRKGFLMLDSVAPDMSDFIEVFVRVTDLGTFPRLIYSEMISGFGNVYSAAEASEDMFPEDIIYGEQSGPRDFSPNQIVIGESFIEYMELEMEDEKRDAVLKILSKAGYEKVAQEITSILSV